MARKLKATEGVEAQAKASKKDAKPDKGPSKAELKAAAGPTPEQIKEWVRRCRAKKLEFETKRDEATKANGSFRAELKAAKAAGCDPDTIVWALKSENRDPAEIDRETRLRNNYAKAIGMPIGTQLGMFDDGETVATKVDQIKIAAAEEKKTDPEALGYEAARAGKTLEQNPYDFESEPENFDAYEKGWGRGMAQNVTGTENGVVQAVTH